jgi:hypothetical protein
LLDEIKHESGRGTMVRYRDGVHVGTAKRDIWSGILTVSGAVGGMVVFSQPAKIKLMLPKKVAETMPEDALISIETLWCPVGAEKKPGDSKVEPGSSPGVWDTEPQPG